MESDGSFIGSGTHSACGQSCVCGGEEKTGPESEKGDVDSRKELCFKSKGNEKESSLEHVKKESSCCFEKGESNGEKAGDSKNQG